MNSTLRYLLLLVGLVCATSAHAAFDLKSKDLKPNATIPMEFVFNGMGCKGSNVSPELHWSGAPKGTKSYAVTVYDPDAPTGSGFWHYVAYDIPATTTSLAKGAKLFVSAKDGVDAPSDYGALGYGGPCPPAGKPHRYIFTVHALNVEKLGVPSGATNAVARFMIQGSSIGKASFTAMFGQ